MLSRPFLIHLLARLRRARPRPRTLALPRSAATAIDSLRHLGPLQTLPLPVAGAHVAANSRSTRVIAAGTALALGSEAAFAVLAAINNILQAFTFARLGDLGPVQVLARFGVVCDVCHGRGGDLALAAGAGARVEVRGRINFLLTRSLELVLRLVVMLLMMLLMVHWLRWGVVLLLLRRGSSGE